MTDSQKEAFERLNEMMVEAGLPPLKDSEIRDWGIQGGESNALLQEWVNDYVSEVHTEKCAAKNSWRYEQ